MSRQKTSIIWSISKEELQEVLDKSYTYSNVLRYFGINPKSGSGNFETLKRRLIEENLDIDNIENPPVGSKSVNRTKLMGLGKTEDELLSLTLNNLLPAHGVKFKERLLSKGILEEKCSICDLGPEWESEPLVLQLDHINGNNLDNRIENLRILCPNCHTQTKTFCGKNKKPDKIRIKSIKSGFEDEVQKYKDFLESLSKDERETITFFVPGERLCKLCGKKFSIFYRDCKGYYCTQKCSSESRRKANRPSKEDLEKLILVTPVTKLGKMYGVSDSAIRKWCKSDGIPLPIKTKKTFKVNCVLCDDFYSILERKVRRESREGREGPFCSQSCATTYWNAIRRGDNIKRGTYKQLADKLGIVI
jgi:hypothetical protein